MGMMKKSDHETVVLWKYLALINKVEDDCFDNSSVRNDMKKRYRGAKRT